MLIQLLPGQTTDAKHKNENHDAKDIRDNPERRTANQEDQAASQDRNDDEYHRGVDFAFHQMLSFIM